MFGNRIAMNECWWTKDVSLKLIHLVRQIRSDYPFWLKRGIVLFQHKIDSHSFGATSNFSQTYSRAIVRRINFALLGYKNLLDEFNRHVCSLKVKWRIYSSWYHIILRQVDLKTLEVCEREAASQIDGNFHHMYFLRENFYLLNNSNFCSRFKGLT